MNRQDAAKRHLWMHFTRMSAYKDGDVPVIVRGEGPYVYETLTVLGNPLERELAMIKVAGKGAKHAEAKKLAESFQAQIID